MADPDKELWENIEVYYGSMDPRTFFIGRPTNMACHDVCLDNKAPAGIEHLLGLGAKYCVKQTKLPANTIDNVMKRMRRNIRWKYIFRTYPEDDNYIPGPRLNSEREPGLANSAIETRMDQFEKAMRRKRTNTAADIST